MWCVMFHSKRVEPMCREVCGARGTTKPALALCAPLWALGGLRAAVTGP